MTGLDFQRARSPEQREARRRAILAVAAELLGEAPLAEISLRELARRVGLSKTNVVRYFETREAVFFALLNQAVADWLDELPAELPRPPAEPPKPPAQSPTPPAQSPTPPAQSPTLPAQSPTLPAEPATSSPAAVAEGLARSLAARPLICELWSALGTQLERNIPAEAVRNFKRANAENQAYLAELLRVRVHGLKPAAAREFVALLILLVAGLWPFANPAPAVVEAIQDPRLAGSRVDFADRLGRSLTVVLTGLLAL